MKRTIIVAATAALIGGAATATANVSHIFGNGGQQYTFDGVCHRTVVLPPGLSNGEAINFLGQQVKCLVQREARMRNCYRHATLTFMDDHHGKPGDWLGVDELKACGSL